MNGVFELLYVMSPRSTNELRLSGNWVPWDSKTTRGSILAVTASPLGDGARTLCLKITHSLSESVLDNLSMQRGRHT